MKSQDRTLEELHMDPCWGVMSWCHHCWSFRNPASPSNKTCKWENKLLPTSTGARFLQTSQIFSILFFSSDTRIAFEKKNMFRHVSWNHGGFPYSIPTHRAMGLAGPATPTMKPWVPRSPWSQALPTPHQRYVPRWGVYKETQTFEAMGENSNQLILLASQKKHRGALFFVEENYINSAPFHLPSRKLPEFSKKVDRFRIETSLIEPLKRWQTNHQVLLVLPQYFFHARCRQRCEACDSIPSGTVPKGCPSSYLTNFLNKQFLPPAKSQKPFVRKNFRMYCPNKSL